MTTFQVSVTDECDNDCPFCISKMTYRVNHNNFDWDNLEYAISYAEEKGIYIAKITGKWGEPLMVPERITGLLTHLSGSFSEIELQTNAKRTWSGRTQWALWKKLGLSLVSISCVHWDYDKNKLIYNQRQEPKEIADHLNGYGYKIRLNCLLLKGWIDSVEKVKEFINRFPDVDQISFIPVGSTNYSSAPNYQPWSGLPVKEWIHNHRISSEEIQKIVNHLNDKYVKVDETCYSHTYHHENMSIYFADCLKIPPLKEEYRHLIYFPDGTLRYSWEDPNSIININ